MIFGRISARSGGSKLASLSNLSSLLLGSKAIARGISPTPVSCSVISRSRHKLSNFGIRQVDARSTTERVGRSASILLARAVLKIVVSWAWNTFFHILIDFVGLSVHTNLGTLSDARGNRVSSSTWNFILTFLDHTRAGLCSDAPSSCLQLCCLMLRVILSR